MCFVIERAAALEIKIQSLETELEESELEANEVIGQWQGNCATAESRCAALEEELKQLEKRIENHDISTGDTINEENYNNIMGALAKKEEELRRLNEDAESSKDSTQKLKGAYSVCCYVSYIFINNF